MSYQNVDWSVSRSTTTWIMSLVKEYFNIKKEEIKMRQTAEKMKCFAKMFHGITHRNDALEQFNELWNKIKALD